MALLFYSTRYRGTHANTGFLCTLFLATLVSTQFRDDFLTLFCLIYCPLFHNKLDNGHTYIQKHTWTLTSIEYYKSMEYVSA